MNIDNYNAALHIYKYIIDNIIISYKSNLTENA